MTTEQHHFVIKDGVLRVIKDMPKQPIKRESFESHAGTVYMGGDFGYEKAMRKYNEALQSAIDNSIEVNDVHQLVMKKIYGEHGHVDGLPENYYAWLERSEGRVYSLDCHVQILPWSTLRIYSTGDAHKKMPLKGDGALVTFPSENREPSIAEQPGEQDRIKFLEAENARISEEHNKLADKYLKLSADYADLYERRKTIEQVQTPGCKNIS